MNSSSDFIIAIQTFQFPLIAFLFKIIVVFLLVAAIFTLIYDRFIQRENQLLINYPLIGRMRYFFYLLRDPMRQYFGDEKFYESFDKVKWVYNAAEDKPLMASFSPEQPQRSERLSIKHANFVLNAEEVDEPFEVIFGTDVKQPFITHSVIGRSAMSDGSISPEGTRAFAMGAKQEHFPINTGEGSLTSNFLTTHGYNPKDNAYLSVKEGTLFAKAVYRLVRVLFNTAIARRVYQHMVLAPKEEESYLFDSHRMVSYRINWNAPLDAFPKKVPLDLPDIIFQMGSGLYGVRDKSGSFDAERYKKVMRFCRMTEIKIAQGAKQTGGKLLANKVSEAIGYYRGIEPHKDLFSPNTFPYAHNMKELFDFIGALKNHSEKPVGIKIVISSRKAFEAYADLIATRIAEGSRSYPDFITIDGADGGSGAAPLEMMMTVGLTIHKALYIAETILSEYGVRDRVKLIASEKVLTPDDAMVLLGVGADYVAIARAFMMSAGCIRARVCSGASGHHCPVGLATQDPKKRASFLVKQKAEHVANYHHQMIYGLKGLMAIMGIKRLSELTRDHLIFKDHTGKTYFDINAYFKEMLSD
ncbi:MAG: FMN-binding glutamate synthase family protein [Epsilonproteobacteria bacterium]|nr:MAG: FMN-binding glutamate synthase family protein [Campylobacterota bacterium]